MLHKNSHLQNCKTEKYGRKFLNYSLINFIVECHSFYYLRFELIVSKVDVYSLPLLSYAAAIRQFFKEFFISRTVLMRIRSQS